MPLAVLPRRLLAWVGLAVLAAHPAVGAPLLRVRQAAGLPFDEQELLEAVALRAAVAPDAAPGAVTVAVEPSGAGRVTIGVEGRQVEAELGRRTGAEAARLVALLVVDATRPPLLLERAVGPRETITVFLAPAVNFALTDAGPSLEPALGLGWPLGRRTHLLVSLGYARARVVDRAGDGVMTFDSLPVRAGAALAAGPIDLQGGLLARGYRAAAVTSAVGLRAGAWLGAAWSIPLPGPVRPFLGAGLDAHPEKLELRRAGRTLLSAGHLAPWAGLGLAWKGGAR
jgi:hypothetical protein